MRMSTLRTRAVLTAVAVLAVTVETSAFDTARAETNPPSFTVLPLTPPVSVGSTVTAVDLDNLNRPLVAVDTGQSEAGYVLNADDSWTKLSDFRPSAFSTIGSLLPKTVVVGNAGTAAQSAAFVGVDGNAERLKQRADAGNPSMVVNDVNRSGKVVGQFIRGNFSHAFTITPQDADGDGTPDTWFKPSQADPVVNELFKDVGENYAQGAASSFLTAVNDDGNFVGSYNDPASGQWKPIGVSGPDGGRPNDIANTNVAAGLNTATQRAWSFPNTDLDPSGSFGSSEAASLNQSNEVVGNSSNESGFYYSNASGMLRLIDLISVQADRRSYTPTKINGPGWITANASNRAYLLIPEAPVLRAEVAPSVRAGGEVEFNASANGGTGDYVYEWSFSDGVQASTTIPFTKHLYDIMTTPVTLTGAAAEMQRGVTLRVRDSDGNQSVPITKTISMCDPALKARSGQEFAGLIRCMEHSFPALNRVEILSMMRKYFYGSESRSFSQSTAWDSLLIPCGASVPDPNPVIPTGLRQRLNEEAKETTSQNVNGTMGHALTALDAFRCFNRSITGVKAENVAFVNWLGDLASAVEQKVVFDVENPGTAPWSDYFGGTKGGANRWNLVGDRDGIVIQYALLET